MKNNLLLTFIIGIFLISMTSAIPPTQTNVNLDTGIQIYYPPINEIKVNQTLNFPIHINNITTGKIINNALVNCSLHLYNQTLEQILSANFSKDANGIDQELLLLGGNFSTYGIYEWVTFCSTDGIGGTASGYFEVTYNGYMISSQGTSLSIMSLVFLILLAVGLVYISNTKIPEGDGRDEEGKIISISYLKHLRWLLWGGVWGIMLSILFILSNLTLAYLPTAMIGNLLFSIYKVLFRLTIPMFVIALIWVIVRFFKDKEFQNMIERGVDLKSEYV